MQQKSGREESENLLNNWKYLLHSNGIAGNAGREQVKAGASISSSRQNHRQKRLCSRAKMQGVVELRGKTKWDIDKDMIVVASSKLKGIQEA